MIIKKTRKNMAEQEKELNKSLLEVLNSINSSMDRPKPKEMLNGKLKTHLIRCHELSDKIAEAFKKGEKEDKAKDKEFKHKCELERREKLQQQRIVNKQKRFQKKPFSLNSFEFDQTKKAIQQADFESDLLPHKENPHNTIKLSDVYTLKTKRRKTLPFIVN